ncbi:helix-turn-helix domain-containing protein [Lihuaxuella thermophila]|uniref:Tetratricopeptide repeat-containing protein n=1 Tax=Lihuaxuella thermophila TaxID=1173111 RepID=A0A1H8H831_9BACL|nr:helix-turn-helix domain-containing protein [Lihuaxuella thermophila]SEN51927.1 Tetratricopeptide repeat-containing protein [Lihuaxuella thermophila]
MSQNRVDRIEFGKFVREQRKAKKLRQGDLVDEFLSQPVLSNIESGKGQVSEEKMKYVLKKLGLEEDLTKFYLQESEQNEDSMDEELQIKLISIENTINLVGPDKASEELRELSLPPKHPFHVWVEYLKGKLYLRKKNWKRAYNHFFNVIHMIDRHYSEMNHTNFKSACYHKLSLIEYLQNNFHQAWKYSEAASKYFVPDGERKYYKDMIRISRVIYLEKLNRIGDAQAVLDDIASDSPAKYKTETDQYHSESKESTLNMYEMQAKLLLKGRRLPQAIKFALKGIELARIDKMYDRSFELWTTLGSIYIELNKLNLAECCFTTALKLEKKIKSEYLPAYVYTQLGMLYYKQEDIPGAERKYFEALEYSRKTNDVYHEIQALIGLGKCSIQRNKRDQVLSHLKEALRLAEQHSFVDQKNETLLILAKYLREIGDPNFKDYALDFFCSYVETLEGGESKMVINENIKRNTTGEPPDD